MPDENQKIDIADLRKQLKERKQTPYKLMVDEPYLVGMSWAIQRLPKQGPCPDAYELPDGLDYAIIKGCLTGLQMKLERLEAQNAGLWQRIDTLERERGAQPQHKSEWRVMSEEEVFERIRNGTHPVNFIP